ncbi:uncharacterized protein LOC119463568 [Dermacentor silvarum]|uniref:uncharacterized protein LOC119463568 n=1 Tax=Dermacentor silvarum TaxID=543639 RepID=UPI002101C889|nr:uncharacterized protein LOC119463568 [Dermacentor silvarum]
MPQLPSPTLRPLYRVSREVRAGPLQKRLSKLAAQCSAFHNKVFDNQARILNELATLRRILAIKPKTVLALPQDCPRLPVEDTEQLLLLEEYLKSPEKFQKLVEYFSRFGGTDMQDSVRTLLKHLITKRTAMQCSWKGSMGKKQSFEKLQNILNIILTSVRSTFPEASLSSIGKVAKKWLAGASDREGGRSERRNQSQRN